jgi:hypothetical protein
MHHRGCYDIYCIYFVTFFISMGQLKLKNPLRPTSRVLLAQKISHGAE